jgi:hypothetical protein
MWMYGNETPMMGLRSQDPPWYSLRQPRKLVDAVLEEPQMYPWRLVQLVNRYALTEFRKATPPLRSAADQQGWFTHDADRVLGTV